jgi:hypothetical protein
VCKCMYLVMWCGKTTVHELTDYSEIIISSNCIPKVMGEFVNREKDSK